MAEVRGRKPGFKHSEETKRRIGESRLGHSPSPETRVRISTSLKNHIRTEEHNENISQGKLDTDRLCLSRFLELKGMYPEHEDFFEENKAPLLIALRDIKSDKEMDDIQRYVEVESLDRYTGTLSYQNASSSVYAQEDAVILLIDVVAYLRKLH
jgi:hypothetical protein